MTSPPTSYPPQPIERDEEGIVRFRRNRAVRVFFDAAREGRSFNLDQLWDYYVRGLYTLDEMEQFYMLIGFSVSGFGETSGFRRTTIAWADKEAEKLLAKTKEGSNR